MAKQIVYHYRIDDPITGKIIRGQTDGIVIIDQNQTDVKKICIISGEMRLEDYNEETKVSTTVIGNIDRAYVSSKLYMNQNLI